MTSFTGASIVGKPAPSALEEVALAGKVLALRGKEALALWRRGPHPNPLPEEEGVMPRPSAAMARVDFPSPLAVPRSAGRGAGMGCAASPCFVL